MPPKTANLPHAQGDTTYFPGSTQRPREAPALAATAAELDPEEAPTTPVLALEEGATDTVDEGAEPCHEGPEEAA